MSDYHANLTKPYQPITIDANTNTIIEDVPVKKGAMPSIMLGLAILYALSPIDLIPDVPIIGWIDDAPVLIAAILNYLEKSGHAHNQFANRQGHVIISILRKVKWIVIFLGLIACSLIGLAGMTVVKTIF